MEQPLKEKLWSASIFSVALSSIFKIQKRKKKLDKIKRVPTLPTGLSSPIVGTNGLTMTSISVENTTSESNDANTLTTVDTLTTQSQSQQQQQQQQQQPQQQQQQQQETSSPIQSSVSNSSSSVTTTPAKKTTKDFIFGQVIGEGSFSTVYLTKDVHTAKEYAIKVCEKRHIMREKKSEYVKRERDVLNILSSVQAPFFVKLYCTFQDTERLYFVLSYAKNGDLLQHIYKLGNFDISCTRFYAAEIILALEHLHKLGIIHRDLKPENILLDEKMHILITDFGSAKLINTTNAEAVTTQTLPTSEINGEVNSSEFEQQQESKRRRNSFVGTAQYVSPELLTDKIAHFASDLWALGCIIYQMVSGLPPFRARCEYAIFRKIIKLEYEFPEGFDSNAQDLVQKLLVVNSNERLGAQDTNGYPSVRNHPMFNGIDFDNILTTTPPTISPFMPMPSSNYKVPDHLEPGLDEQLSRLLGLQSEQKEAPVRKKSGVTNVLTTPELAKARLDEQRITSKWHNLVGGNLILKQGLVNKRKGLFARRRMLLLTDGPHLYYVDPDSMTVKGEIPFSQQISAEPKNFKIFFVHTPNRTYYLEDPEGYALEWCKAIEDMKTFTYGP